VPAERFTGLAAVLDAIRTGDGITQSVLVERVGLGRSVVAQRISELEAAGLVASGGLGPSTGGRAPRRLRLRAEAGFVLGLDIASNELVVGVADLAGAIVARRHEHIDVARGPDEVLAMAERMSSALLDETGARARLWSVGIGLPEPVTFDKRAHIELPTMPDWDRFPLREHLAALLPAPVWIDHRVNLLALGERRVNPLAARSEHMLYVGGGAAMDAAVVVDGRIYRGARGLAGAIGHVAVPGSSEAVCRCGNVGCLDAVAGGAALARDARLLAETGQSTALAAVLAENRTIRPVDVTRAAEDGDPAARALLNRAAMIIGGGLASVVNVFNPDLVVVGGGLARAGTHVLVAIREAIHRHALAAAARDLRVELSVVDEEIAGVSGAVQFALGELFSRDHLARLLEGMHDQGRAAPGLSA
jgi:predicted NBD/HSP70 family sugar kinase